MKKILAIVISLFTTTVSAVEITGAGATFPFPVYSKWAYENGDKIANELDYVPISDEEKTKIIKGFGL